MKMKKAHGHFGKRLAAAMMMGLLPFGAMAEDMRIVIPDASGLHLYSPDDFKGLVSFTGEVKLAGTLFARSVADTVDDQAQWRRSLVFKPDAGEYEKLPRVHVAGEKEGDGEFVIEMNFFQKEKMGPDVENIFGNQVAEKMKGQPFEAGLRGIMVLDAYRTGIECDRRYHYARLVSFQVQTKLSQDQVRRLAAQSVRACVQ